MDNLTNQTIQRFKSIREENHLTQSDFAKVLNIKNSTADIERGKTKISGTVVSKLLQEFGVNPLWLFGESDQKKIQLQNGDVAPKVVTVDSENNENIVLVNVKAAAGYPHNVQDVDWYQQLPAFDIPLPEYRNATYRGFQVEGDSMLPVLEPKEWVIGKAVNNLSELRSNALYVIVLQDSVVVKKVRKNEDSSSLTLISLNVDYLPFTIQAHQIVEIWEVNSKLSFNIDANSDTASIKQLQDAMMVLTSEVRNLKN
ncbi:Phage repressor protein C, contains Cro/C1-type HTH and peptisase s24 domains [Aquimarina amphilecti]|uniref:Phage repressor protein C, contains Cro/C1-type HTH and peptisase s24 domains n=1 Tax=Aquimarina amphilecti TaxID=1038014 RepID=A0A1H7MY08_AQUAM|nr:LexA family transcriptional regulator [Aquimarina amphilecti]SEL16093.1 Phage repressor protein C, contains Cro/C1-type HTH and peptisase s24 domains [Aquimarina amphilecti]